MNRRPRPLLRGEFAAGLIGVLALLLAGCGGWYLRGAVPLPEVLERTHIDGASGTTDMQRALQRGLEGAGATVVDDPADATARLRVTGTDEEQRTLVVGADGRADEYELRFSADFELRDARGEVLVAEERMEQRRELQFDAGDNPLASGNEAERLRENMRRELATSILRRLNAAVGE
ncbi:MAG: LPS assembly lipoprotein LptE [Pseudomonadota bacterium]